MKYLKYLSIILYCFVSVGCGSQSDELDLNNTENTNPPIHPLGDNPEICSNTDIDNTVNWEALENEYCYKLSNFNLFDNFSNISITPKLPGLSYELNSELFTDHARKYRFLFIPENEKITYNELEAFTFPIGSTLVKVFSLPSDTSSEDEEVIEVRLLVRRINGWVTLVYKWIPEFSEGYFTVAGDIIESVVSHNGVANAFDYRIPTFGQCATCHQNNANEAKITPIGLKARHLNRNITYNNLEINQLTLWNSLEIINNLPSDITSIDTAPNWRDSSKELQDRAKAYLDINCAHCHTEGGSGDLSGLRMEYWRKTIDYSHGVCNESQGWRVGGYDIWPGRGDVSHIPLRITLTSAKDRMPPIGRSLVDSEAAQLISDWIDTLPYRECGGS